MSSEISNIRRVFAEKIAPKAGKISEVIKGEKNLPVGVFDSGVGGLTVLSEIFKLLPSEDIIYLADTARVPFGGRAPQEIIKINTEILDYFQGVGVKMVVMACGTSSAIAYPVLKDKYRFPIVSLIPPGVEASVKASRNLKIGLIATQATVQSHAYQNAIHELNSDALVFAEACPLFVPLIEGGFVETDETKKVAREYLKPLLKERIDTLILGCTHYPHLTKILREITGPDVVFVDPAEYAVEDAKGILTKNGLLSAPRRKGKIKYVVTGSAAHFEELGSRLLGNPVSGARQITLT